MTVYQYAILDILSKQVLDVKTWISSSDDVLAEIKANYKQMLDTGQYTIELV